MLTVKFDNKHLYLSIGDVRYIQPSGSKVNTEIKLKDGTMIVVSAQVKKIDELLKQTQYVELKARWKINAPEFRRKNLVGV